ncbi:MAG: hypothetical protein KJ927_11735 [Candidatus Eisenbacteria bacterium]|nr:hypothetical protein [Candidatus Eisenbacteria bacterium]
MRWGVGILALVVVAAAIAILSGCEKESPTVPPIEPGPTWSHGVSIHDAREKSGAVEWEGKVYLIGGGRTSTFGHYPGVEVFDPDSARWIEYPQLKFQTNIGTVFAAAERKVYAVSGRADDGPVSRLIEVFDPADMSIDFINVQMAAGHKDGAAVVVPAGLMVLGGLDTPGAPTDLVEIIDLNAPSVSQETRLPYTLQDFSVFHLDGHVYVIGGQRGNARTDSVAVYNLIERTWEVIDNALPVGWEHPRVVNLEGRIIVMTGNGNAGRLNGWFDTETRSWFALTSLPEARSQSAVVTVSGKIWVITGLKEVHGVEAIVDDVWIYDPAGEPNDAAGVTARFEGF